MTSAMLIIWRALSTKMQMNLISIAPRLFTGVGQSMTVQLHTKFALFKNARTRIILSLLQTMEKMENVTTEISNET